MIKNLITKLPNFEPTASYLALTCLILVTPSPPPPIPERSQISINPPPTPYKNSKSCDFIVS